LRRGRRAAPAARQDFLKQEKFLADLFSMKSPVMEAILVGGHLPARCQAQHAEKEALQSVEGKGGNSRRSEEARGDERSRWREGGVDETANPLVEFDLGDLSGVFRQVQKNRPQPFPQEDSTVRIRLPIDWAAHLERSPAKIEEQFAVFIGHVDSQGMAFPSIYPVIFDEILPFRSTARRCEPRLAGWCQR
jgi:hypothetical protein